jgi:excinuclease UvrABC nuclease subunit
MSRETVKSCMVFEERASTPPEIRKYRRSTNLEPGNRFKHHGVVDDYEAMDLDRYL